MTKPNLQFPRKKLIFMRRVAANRPRSTDHIRTCCGTCKKGSEAQRIEPTTQGLPGGALLRGGGAEREQEEEQGRAKDGAGAAAPPHCEPPPTGPPAAASAAAAAPEAPAPRTPAPRGRRGGAGGKRGRGGEPGREVGRAMRVRRPRWIFKTGRETEKWRRGAMR